MGSLATLGISPAAPRPTASRENRAGREPRLRSSPQMAKFAFYQWHNPIYNKKTRQRENPPWILGSECLLWLLLTETFGCMIPMQTAPRRVLYRRPCRRELRSANGRPYRVS